MTELTDLQESFCQVRAYNPKYTDTECYKESGYSWENMKPETINRRAHHLMQQDKIKARIAELKAEQLERVQIDADYVLKRLVEIDQLDIADILTETGDIKEVRQWPKAWRTLVHEMEVRIDSREDAEGVLKKIKFPSKLQNLQQLGKHVSVMCFSEKMALTGASGSGPVEHQVTTIERRIVRPGGSQ